MAENTFIIRIWCEHSEYENIKPQLRGVIEHVISGQRQYLNNTESIPHFIQAHLPGKPACRETQLIPVTHLLKWK